MPCTTEPLLKAGQSGEYLESVDHILVWGTEQEIGRSLAELGQSRFGVRLAHYEAPEGAVLAAARRRYFERNWPEMRARMCGVAAFWGGETRLDTHDTSALIYDLAPDSVPRSACSAAFLPRVCTVEEHPLVARNFDAWQRRPREIFNRNPKDKYDRNLYSRPFVMEISPASGHQVLVIGGHDLLFPFQDAINDAGLFVTSLADRNPAVIDHMSMAGGRNTGLTSRQVLLLLASRCATVADAKTEILAHQVRMDTKLHWLIADASGAATVLEIDDHGCVCFVDAPTKRQPFAITNHQLSQKTNAREHLGKPYNSFTRLVTLEDRAQALLKQNQGKLTRRDAEELMDSVVCAYVDPDAAGVDPAHATLTIWTLTADLTAPDLEIGFYLRSAPPHPIPNRKTVEWKKWRLGFGFSREDISEKPAAPPTVAASNRSEHAPAPVPTT
ncbi:MAG TPA: linear amide C-N hydrolase [Stellaceae bacterium]|nr:linear amide C-N hydrolase [Stellaceae bacterium]